MKHLPLVIQPGSHLPLALQLKQQIIWLIATGFIVSGEKLPSIRNLATQTGVHYHTVRVAYRQLAGDGLVALRHGSGAHVLPFTGLQLASPTGSAPTHTIGVLIAGLDPFYLPFLRGIEEVATSLHALTVICNTEDNPVKAKLQINQLVARGVDGIIAASVGNLLQQQVEGGPSRAEFPIVYCDQPDMDGHSFLFDAENAGYQATKHLLKHGHQRIGLITAPVDWPNMHELYSGYRRALQEAGEGIRQSLIGVSSRFSVSHGIEVALSMLAGSKPPTAFFATADVLGIGALSAVKSIGKRVPEDIAVIGFSDIDFASLVEPPLTTVAAPVYEMGKEAMKILGQLIAGTRIDPSIKVLETRLVVRRSCGCFPETKEYFNDESQAA